MAKAYWKAVHVRTLAELPENLIKGRAYFIDDQGFILINFGDNKGVKFYGNRPGIQGPPGEPIPSMLDDINTNSESIIRLARVISEVHRTHSERFDNLEELIGDLLGVVLYQQNINLDEIREAAASQSQDSNETEGN